MDFTLDEDLLAVRELSRTIFTDQATTARVRAVEETPTRIDEDLWQALAQADLLGLALSEKDGGSGLGLAGLAVLLEEQGRHVAPVPLWSHSVATWAVARYGSLVRETAEGKARLTVALEEYGRSPQDPGCVATCSAGSWRLTGTKAAVPSPAGAAHVVVSAAGLDGPAIFLVPGEGEGVSWHECETTAHERAAELSLTEAPAQPMSSAAFGGVLRAAAVAIAAVQLGVADGALHLAASYTSAREQFGRPLATFQSLQHQLADCLIDLDAMRVTLWQAIQAMDTGDADAERAVQVASWWRAQGGLDVVYRVQHVHGGIGVDVDYPVHRHFLWGRQLAGTLGGPTAVLSHLGDLLAANA
ncbi:acyl-CoA dehydrogenase family protein [Amycolatopsis alba]|uniref:Acyl-CoA dehydrogenase n=1 Tax=Amycolatopsis alba DSM 44262 TaxID=1125972 RepID=A0A229R9Y4_AMYAL|nr:acyl-CoA dehydrogenase family protein [Amycolatopsis alba]OXM43470.1 acyl-CoA dehydrogenase [Amycolatopsis alba DSM 44262]